jgi:hypothetical protein
MKWLEFVEHNARAEEPKWGKKNSLEKTPDSFVEH